MPRHYVRRDDRARAEEETTELESRMVTYEEAILESGASGFSFPKIFEFPRPNKINEMEPVDRDAFSARKSPFFTKRPIGRTEEDDVSSREQSPTGSTEAEENDSEGTSSESGAEEDIRQRRDWKLAECYWFCLRQLFFSRLWILILQFIASNYAGERFRTDAFNMADRAIEPGKSVLGDLVVRRGLLGLRRWDAQQFLFIADNHYVFEHSLAFFPGFPEVINIIRIGIQQHMTQTFGWTFPPWVITGLLSFIINFFFFHVAGFVLFIVVAMMTRNIKQALIAVSIFAFNPASIFFTSAYSESMFFTLTLTGFSLMLFALRTLPYFARLAGSLIGSIVFGLSLVARSNGLLNLLFVAWYWCGALLWEPEHPIPECHKLIESIAGTKNERYRREGQTRLRQFEQKRKQLRKVFRWTEPGFSRCALVFVVIFLAFVVLFSFFLPYVFMSNSVAEEFCQADPHQKELVAKVKKQIRMSPDIITLVDAWEKTTWCKKEKLFGIVHHFYGEIQSKYWGVRLFGYWKIKKIPCFLMMLPAAILTILAIKMAWKDVFEDRRWNNIWVLTVRSDHMIPLAIHASIVLLTAIFYINAEVFTRLIFSSSPFLYIYIAQYIDKLTQGNTPGNRLWHYTSSPGILPFFVFRRVWEDGWRGKALYIYIFGYFIFGTMAHAAWLPFT